MNDDKPLFVLKYAPGKKLTKVFFLYVPCTAFLCFLALALSGSKYPFMRIFGPIWFIPAILAFIFLIYITLFVKEIRLYADRVVMILYFTGRREIIFEDAFLTIKEELWRTEKMFYYPARGTFKTVVNLLRQGIYIDETVADKEDIKKFNAILEEITGKQISNLKKLPATISLKT
jgi:hypothetical protein